MFLLARRGGGRAASVHLLMVQVVAMVVHLVGGRGGHRLRYGRLVVLLVDVEVGRLRHGGGVLLLLGGGCRCRRRRHGRIVLLEVVILLGVHEGAGVGRTARHEGGCCCGRRRGCGRLRVVEAGVGRRQRRRMARHLHVRRWRRGRAGLLMVVVVVMVGMVVVVVVQVLLLLLYGSHGGTARVMLEVLLVVLGVHRVGRVGARAGHPRGTIERRAALVLLLDVVGGRKVAPLVVCGHLVGHRGGGGRRNQLLLVLQVAVLVAVVLGVVGVLVERRRRVTWADNHRLPVDGVVEHLAQSLVVFGEG